MHSTLPTSARVALMAALISGFALAEPTVAGAQSTSPAQALLNRSETAPRGIVTAGAQSQPTQIIHGERALLNRTPTDGRFIAQRQTSQPDVAAAPYGDGVRALLNRSSW